MSDVQVYISSVSSNLELKKQQQKIQMVLESKHISVEYIDIATSESGKVKMREIAGNPTALPPQFARGNRYLGDYEAFDEAIENEALSEFLQIK